MAGKFEISEDAAGGFRFRLKATNGEIVLTSESYATKASAVNGIESVQQNAPGARVEDLTGFNLKRFVDEQDRPGDSDNYRAAEKELHAGRKRSHWIWFVFPQLDGAWGNHTVGTFTKRLAIKSSDEARAYLAHEVLGPRLHRCAKLVLSSGASNANTLMGGNPTDVDKLQASMTLFAEVAKEDEDDGDFVAVLNSKFYRGHRHAKTLALLKSESKTTRALPPDPPLSKRRRRPWTFRRSTS